MRRKSCSTGSKPRSGGHRTAFGCAYCLSAHTAGAGLLGIDAHEIDRNRTGESDDERAAAVNRVARPVIDFPEVMPRLAEAA